MKNHRQMTTLETLEATTRALTFAIGLLVVAVICGGVGFTAGIWFSQWGLAVASVAGAAVCCWCIGWLRRVFEGLTAIHRREVHRREREKRHQQEFSPYV